MSATLAKVAAKITTGREFMGSIWQNAEAEVIATQTITACANNLKNHGEALSWLGDNATRGRAQCGTDNAAGLARLIAEGYLTQEAYEGHLQPPEQVARKGGKPMVLRVTQKLLDYAYGFFATKS